MTKKTGLARTTLATAMTAGLLLLTACGQTAAATEPSAETSPREIENCGTTVSIDAVPERVFTIKSTPLEMMLALGLEDRIIGSSFLDGDVPEMLTPEGWQENIVAEQLPGKEALLELDPDLVFAGWTSNLSADGIGTREELAGFGIESYVSPVACDFGEAGADAIDFADVFDMFAQVGDIFEVESAASDLIAAQQDRLDRVIPAESTDGDQLTALWYSSGADTPFVGGGTGVPNMIMDAAGLENVVADETESWLSLSWESFIASDPDVIVLVSSEGNTAEAKRERIAAHPAASQMRAVRAGNFISVDFAETEGGVRNVDAVEKIAAAAAELAAAPE